jgi:outer membrane protein OmpA-like peptidoglycan-associated protein
MKKFKYLFFAVFLMLATHLYAQKDVEGSKDVPYISRFKGSWIVWQQNLNFDNYYILKIEDNKLNRYQIEGKIIRTQYDIEDGHSVLEIFKSYENALKSAGFKILMTLNEQQYNGNLSEDLYNAEFKGMNKLPHGAIKPDYRDKYYYFAAKKHINAKDVYIVGFISQWDKPLITLDIIETQPMEEGLVTVKKISEGIDAEGHIAIYDIHFNTGSATISSKSADALKNIAEYLMAHKDKKFLVVGHTDNTGNYEGNLKLSQERAKAVVTELISKYGVDAAQLKAFGAGQAAPVATNANEDGKKMNRRVEIVLM